MAEPIECLADVPVEEKPELTEAQVAEVHLSEEAGADAEADAFRIRTDIRSANFGPNAMHDPPWGIVWHHTAGAEHVDLPTLTRRGTGVSSNYYVTKQGVIFELVPFPRRAWAQGVRDASQAGRYYEDGNTWYISIEIENYGNNRDPYPDVQVDAIVWLTRKIRERFPNIDHPDQIFRHRDFAPSRKTDTSDNFPFEEARRRVMAKEDSPAPPKPGSGYKPSAPVTIVHADTDWTRARAERIKATFPRKVALETDAKEAKKLSKFCLDNPEYGEYTCVALGAKSVPMLHPDAVKAMKRYGRDKCDVWSAVDTEESYASFAKLVDRYGEARMKKRYEEEFGKRNPKPKAGPPKPERPSKPPKDDIDVGDYTENWRSVVHRYFGSLQGWGIAYREEDGVEVARVADEKGLDLALCLALVEQESQCRRVMGCDHGRVGDRPPYCNQEATRERVQALIGSDRNFPRGRNGVSHCQLTWHAYVLEAEKLGGAHLPRPNMLVGFEIIRSGLAGGQSLDEVLGRFNAGSNWRSVYAKYINPVKAKQDAWQRRLAK